MTTPNGNDQPHTIPMRRYVFSTIIIGAMLLAAYFAVRTGLEILETEECADASLGTISLVVSPIVSVVAAISAVLANLLRQD